MKKRRWDEFDFFVADMVAFLALWFAIGVIFGLLF